MATLSGPQLYQLAVNAGFPAGTVAQTAGAVALAESSGRTDVISATGDYGPWQINLKAHPDLFRTHTWSDPQQNAAMAYSVFHAAGNSFTPWTTYKSGRYRMYMNQVIGPSGVLPGDNGGAIGMNVPGGLTGSASGLPNSGVDTSVITGAITAVSQTSFWLRVGMFLGGLALAIIGLHGLLSQTQTYRNGVSAVKKGLEVAAL